MKDFFIIAGPCSAESLEQVTSCALELKKNHLVKMFRAGIWKPRTSPHSFQGMGTLALPWLKKVQEELQFPCMVEVGNAEHVKLALQQGLKGVWIGARTVVNPFSVQEIVQALEEAPSDLIVAIKNPIHPDIHLWKGAVERIQSTHLKNILLIHRGFSLYGKQGFRNPPLWELALTMRKAYPHLPMLLDPSHMAGKKELIPTLLQIAVERDYQGIFIEVHPYPQNALSDKEQQITPAELEVLLEKLNWKKILLQDLPPNIALKVKSKRKEIDEIDFQIISLIAKRLEIVRGIHLLKKDFQLTPLQFDRFQELLQQRIKWAKEMNLSEDSIQEIFNLIHELSLSMQITDE